MSRATQILAPVRPPAPVDAVFALEQRRFRRLEVSLVVWIASKEAFETNSGVWRLGYTRDLSLGGAKITLPPDDASEWQRAVENQAVFVVRVENGARQGEAIPAWVRHVERDAATGRLSLGIQFQADVAHAARAEAVRAGLQSLRKRRKWQLGFGVALAVAAFGLASVNNLSAEVAQKAVWIAQLEKRAQKTELEISKLEKPTLVSTKTQGIDRAFEGARLKDELATLRENMARLNDPRNQRAAMKERERGAQKLGISLAPTSDAARTQLAVAFPYGYNWPLVVGELERALARKIPHIVVFRDWSQPFPDLDAREARALGKTLQITWEPWHFSNPNAVKLSDIAAGKYDAYVEKFAAQARSFGGEIWLRWGHEMNGNWYPWSLANNNSSPKNWLAAYKRIHARFQKAGASNVRWVWCFNAESVPSASWNDPFATYPGDDLVDAVAVDGYNFGDTTHFSRWQSFEAIFSKSYAEMTRRFPQKPLWIAETACASTGGDKAKWLREMDVTLRTKFPKIESVTWFEAAKEADWRLVSSLESATTARKVWGQNWYRRGEN